MIPKIQDFIDLKKYPYVCPFNLKIQTKYGEVLVPRGFLADGASGFCIIDLDEEAFFVHDLLYLMGNIKGEKITKHQADKIYGKMLWDNHRYFRAFIRPLGLLMFGGKAWKKHREAEKVNPLHWMERFVPHKYSWEFPNWNTEDAVWIDDPITNLQNVMHPLKI